MLALGVEQGVLPRTRWMLVACELGVFWGLACFQER